MKEINITKNGEITLNRQTGLFNVWDCTYSHVLYSSPNILDADKFIQDETKHQTTKTYKVGDAIQVLLLGDGCYSGLGSVEFPVRVMAVYITSSEVVVCSKELRRVGADKRVFSCEYNYIFVEGEYTAIL